MKHETKIEWTHFPGYRGSTWNPTIGCRRKSEGCENCYAEKAAASVFRQFAAIDEPTERQERVRGAYGRALRFDKNGKLRGWSGEATVLDERLVEPMRRAVPTVYFVNSMSDLFYPGVSDMARAAIFGAMAAAKQHVFIVLTKYVDEAAGFFEFLRDEWAELGEAPGTGLLTYTASYVGDGSNEDQDRWCGRLCDATGYADGVVPWPLPNVILMVSAENQAEADDRIPKLLRLPAAARGVSYEPALGGVDFGAWPDLDWIVVGGESGPGARPFDPAWARETIAASRAAGVPVFMKQLGSNPVGSDLGVITHKKGGEPGEWPDDLRVREFPRRFV